VARGATAAKGEHNARLKSRVADAAERALAHGKYVAPVDVLVLIGWLSPNTVEAWRQGRLDCLEPEAAVGRDRVDVALELLRRWAEERRLNPSETAYVGRSRSRRPLLFTADGDETRERAYRTHWISAELSPTQQQRLTERQSRGQDLVVIEPHNDFECTSCGGGGAFLIMEGDGPLCMTCADMDHLVFLPAGDATLSRRAKKESGLSAVVVRFSRTRKRYERQGILVEEPALDRAEEQCLADEELRKRRRERAAERRPQEDLAFQARIAKEILRLFPGCPPKRAEEIAGHTGVRGSGRVGRSAAGRALDEEAITGAVIASVRHLDTEYDELLMKGYERAAARSMVWDEVEEVLEAWRAGRPRP
jgi:hypothetical protein